MGFREDRARTSIARRAFFAVIAIKGLDGALETAAGLLLAVAGSRWLYDYTVWFIAPEIAQRVGDRTAHLVSHGAAGLMHAGSFPAVYLLAHGVLKLALAIFLLRRATWIFPVAALILFGFVCYLGHRAISHSSPWSAGFAAFDAITLALVLNEWRARAKTEPPQYRPA
ncbi:MAG: DUF2127 domain-containing protein [Rhizomicrobium sp.]